MCIITSSYTAQLTSCVFFLGNAKVVSGHQMGRQMVTTELSIRLAQPAPWRFDYLLLCVSRTVQTNPETCFPRFFFPPFIFNSSFCIIHPSQCTTLTASAKIWCLDLWPHLAAVETAHWNSWTAGTKVLATICRWHAPWARDFSHQNALWIPETLLNILWTARIDHSKCSPLPSLPFLVAIGFNRSHRLFELRMVGKHVKCRGTLSENILCTSLNYILSALIVSAWIARGFCLGTRTYKDWHSMQTYSATVQTLQPVPLISTFHRAPMMSGPSFLNSAKPAWRFSCKRHSTNRKHHSQNTGKNIPNLYKFVESGHCRQQIWHLETFSCLYTLGWRQVGIAKPKFPRGTWDATKPSICVGRPSWKEMAEICWNKCWRLGHLFFSICLPWKCLNSPHKACESICMIITNPSQQDQMMKFNVEFRIPDPRNHKQNPGWRRLYALGPQNPRLWWCEGKRSWKMLKDEYLETTYLFPLFFLQWIMNNISYFFRLNMLSWLSKLLPNYWYWNILNSHSVSARGFSLNHSTTRVSLAQRPLVFKKSVPSLCQVHPVGPFLIRLKGARPVQPENCVFAFDQKKSHTLSSSLVPSLRRRYQTFLWARIISHLLRSLCIRMMSSKTKHVSHKLRQDTFSNPSGNFTIK